MPHGSCHLLTVKLLMIILLPVAMFAEANAQIKRGISNPLEVSVYVPGGRTLFVPSTTFKLSDGIELMASYRPARFVNLAGVFTHYADGVVGTYQEEKIKFGVGAFVTTDWGRLYPQARRFNFVHYRAKIGVIYDLTGMDINTWSGDSSLGRFRESRMIVGLELGSKIGQGMIFMGFSYFRSMNSFTGGSIDTDNNNHFVVDVGISLL